MTSVLLAAALIVQDPAATVTFKVPYTEKDSARYAVKMVIDDPASGEKVDVEMTAVQAITKKSDKGFDGSFGWTNLYVMGQQQPDESFTATLKSNGVLKSVDSQYGPGMRRMLLPFYLAYPDQPVAVGGTWTYKDESADETDAHKAVFEYKLVGAEAVKTKKAHKVTVKFSEVGPEPLKGDGTYWIGEDGRVLKYELNLTGWTVPVAGQIFTAKITAELSS